MSDQRAAAVHDLGYKRYEGTRRPQSARFRVVARNLIATSWTGWWRMKLWAVGVAIISMIFAAVIYATMFLAKNPLVSGAMGGGGMPLRRSDFMLPSAFDPLTGIAFILGLTVIAGIVANDTRAGAFEFYFARPLRPIDYVAGKLLGAIAIVGVATIGGPVLIAIARIGLAGSGSEVAASLHLLPRAIAAGAIAAVVYAVVPLAISSLASKRAYTIAGWAILYWIIGFAAIGIGHEAGVPALSALSIKGSVMSLTFYLFDIQRIGHSGEFLPSPGAAAIALALYAAGGLALVLWRVRRAEHAGMGGS